MSGKNPKTAPKTASKTASKTAANEGQILSLVHGSLEYKPWYPSYYPDTNVGPSPVERLFVCKICFKYTANGSEFHSHILQCEAHPQFPGKVIREYSCKHAYYKLHEIDGEDEPLFCQNLGLFSKLFLEQKSVCFAPQPFMYYLLTRAYDDPVKRKWREPVGFFSKEKLSWDNNILACILVFPFEQRRGYGWKLIKLSYELAKEEGRVGGPEKPLSEQGKRRYEAYWADEITNAIMQAPASRPLTIKDISDETFVQPSDIVQTLSDLQVLGKTRKDGSLIVNKDVMRARNEARRRQ